MVPLPDARPDNLAVVVKRRHAPSAFPAVVGPQGHLDINKKSEKERTNQIFIQMSGT